MDEKRQMYTILKRAEQDPDLTLSVQSNDTDAPLIEKLLLLNLLQVESAMYGGRVLKLTGQGLKVVSSADLAGVSYIEWSPQQRPITFHQSNYGTANTQLGDRNVMHVQVGSHDAAHLLKLIEEARALLPQLPEEDRDEAENALKQSEKAIKSGAFEKFKTYGPVLLGLGLQTAEFATKVKALFGG
ncbi:hypothetical protein [Deinococcus soli (ex Cha et al. 2016)]|uniref:Uncharacterized protein n=2 Tax=Deinococcus soli (ex Cha et al. 2016) TaxID=1309411 RepID=A0AAE3XJI3_9DEIO|nr:hypothetical protein [Deinococcus soli (ex Cha et al. 2016)]MDR6221455.1 hypothetical protein [Deinococcus soli (ex Cha et al. 2016)]MDR6331445.1 hypothetical protein [Deinococcus soli (ex Cha et al. 2016)]MDR6754604.1 hypothetical protein [Deinococcus soli (ex Cha et al. 2016)]